MFDPCSKGGAVALAIGVAASLLMLTVSARALYSAMRALMRARAFERRISESRADATGSADEDRSAALPPAPR